MEPLLKKDSLEAIKSVLIPCEAEETLISKNSFGEMDKKDLGLQDGSMTLNAEKWLEEVKLFGIIIVAILFSLGLSYLISRKQPDFKFNGKSYKMEGIAEIQDKDRKVYVPVYKESP